MASPERTLNVILSPTAAAELHEIWQWNAERYSPSHADIYVRHLRDRLFGLARSQAQGTVVSRRPDLRYIIIRRSARSHGHIVVYRAGTAAVEVLHIFHTAQDWQTKLTNENANQ